MELKTIGNEIFIIDEQGVNQIKLFFWSLFGNRGKMNFLWVVLTQGYSPRGSSSNSRKNKTKVFFCWYKIGAQSKDQTNTS